jgi:hypothetical protein
MNLTTLLAITLVVVIFLLTILFIKHKKLRTNFNNYNPNPVFGPGDNNYGRNKSSSHLREIRLERLRYFISFKWTWYWMTEKYRKERKTKKDFKKFMFKSVEKRDKQRKEKE